MLRNFLPKKRYLKLIISISLILLVKSSEAQLFLKAPFYKKKIQKIIEWNRAELTDKSTKGSTSIFDKSGNLIRYSTQESDNHYYYNAQKKLVKIKEKGTSKRLTQISYKGNAVIKELSFRGKVYKTETYYKGAQLLEQKVFVKGAELGNKYMLKEKLILSYNKFDSLERELHYIYSIPTKAKPEKRRTIYQYDLATKKLVSKIFYDTDGTIRKKSTYLYSSNQLAEQKDYYPSEKRNTSTKFLYKAGKLWQRVFQDKNKKNIWIYADDRLVRLRSYFGDKLFQIIDYQYFYY